VVTSEMSLQERPGAAALFERARSGDSDAFTALLEPRIHRLVRTARAILVNEADAHDATQRACVSAWVNLRQLRDPGRLDAWLNRLVVNQCRDAALRTFMASLSQGSLIDVLAHHFMQPVIPRQIESQISALLAAVRS
jgi:DNA-directed RNA polymerase specialized sigma24 family protein